MWAEYALVNPARAATSKLLIIDVENLNEFIINQCKVPSFKRSVPYEKFKFIKINQIKSMNKYKFQIQI